MDPILTSHENAVSDAVVDQLKRTKGWALFFSILLWIGAAFMILGGLFMMGMGIFAGVLPSEFSDGVSSGMGMPGLAGLGMFLAMGVMYLLIAALYIYPALKLGKFSRQIANLCAQPTESNLIAALNEQRAFWKFTGISAITFIVLYIVGIAVFFIFSMVMAGTASSGGFSTDEFQLESPLESTE